MYPPACTPCIYRWLCCVPIDITFSVSSTSSFDLFGAGRWPQPHTELIATRLLPSPHRPRPAPRTRSATTVHYVAADHRRSECGSHARRRRDAGSPGAWPLQHCHQLFVRGLLRSSARTATRFQPSPAEGRRVFSKPVRFRHCQRRTCGQIYPLPTENLLENTVGVLRPPRGGRRGGRSIPSLFSRGCSLLLLCMLTAALF